jgi:hypothetical protein
MGFVGTDCHSSCWARELGRTGAGLTGSLGELAAQQGMWHEHEASDEIFAETSCATSPSSQPGRLANVTKTQMKVVKNDLMLFQYSLDYVERLEFILFFST